MILSYNLVYRETVRDYQYITILQYYRSEYTNDFFSHLKVILDLRNLEHEISELEVHPIPTNVINSTRNNDFNR